MGELARIYSNEVSVADQVNARIKELKISKAELAIQIDQSRSMVSQYLNNKYMSDATKLEEKLIEFLQSTGHVTEAQVGKFLDTGIATTHIFESCDFTSVIGLCMECQEDMALGLVVGSTGTGKTHTLKHFAKMPRVAYIECDDTMACRDLVDDIEKSIGIPTTYGTIHKRISGIIEFFNVNEGYLLIVDEADKLISKYTQKKMEILRAIIDKADVGMVIAGEPRLESEIKGYLQRLGNRIDLYWKFKGLNKEEVEKYLSEYDMDADALQELVLRACNKKSGCFRLLDRTVKNVVRIMRDNKSDKVTLAIIKQASNMMML